jgi:hypothetical protein
MTPPRAAVGRVAAGRGGLRPARGSSLGEWCDPGPTTRRSGRAVGAAGGHHHTGNHLRRCPAPDIPQWTWRGPALTHQ